MFSGSIVAIITPFKNGKVDYAAFEKLIEFHIKNGTSGIVPCGTTGESATLTVEEHIKVIETAVLVSKKRIPIIAGTGSNNTAEAIELSKHSEKIGADGCLLVSPYYNKPTQKGLYLHFKAIADAIKIPIILYNIQSRTAVNIEPETILKLSKIKNIIAVKEASGNLEQMSRIIFLCKEKITLLSGDDALTLPLLSIGGKGVISVVANIVPKDVNDMISFFEKGDIKKAQEMHYKLLPLIKAMFIETNPQPVKTAMALMGYCSEEIRLPMCSLLDENKEKLKDVLIEYGLLSK